MRSVAIFIIFLWITNTGLAQLDRVRTAFFSASSSAGKAAFFRVVNENDCSSAILLAYKGAATAMQADVTSSVSEKMNYFSMGKQMIEAAVKANMSDPEIRFLRFAVQSEVPFFLGYCGDLDADAAVIIQSFEQGISNVKHWFWQNAMVTMIVSGELSNLQEDSLNKFVKVK